VIGVRPGVPLGRLAGEVLKRPRSANAGRQDEWRQYVDNLLARHGRKYTLVPQLKQLFT